MGELNIHVAQSASQSPNSGENILVAQSASQSPNSGENIHVAQSVSQSPNSGENIHVVKVRHNTSQSSQHLGEYSCGTKCVTITASVPFDNGKYILSETGANLIEKFRKPLQSVIRLKCHESSTNIILLHFYFVYIRTKLYQALHLLYKLFIITFWNMTEFFIHYQILREIIHINRNTILIFPDYRNLNVKIK